MMRAVFFLVARIILRRERSKLARLESRAKTYEEIRIENNIVAKTSKTESQKSNLCNSSLSTHFATHFSDLSLHKLSIRREFTLWFRKYDKLHKQYNPMTEIWRPKYQIQGRKIAQPRKNVSEYIACGKAGQRDHITAPDFEDARGVRTRPSRKRTFVIKGDRKMYGDTP